MSSRDHVGADRRKRIDLSPVAQPSGSRSLALADVSNKNDKKYELVERKIACGEGALIDAKTTTINNNNFYINLNGNSSFDNEAQRTAKWLVKDPQNKISTDTTGRNEENYSNPTSSLDFIKVLENIHRPINVPVNISHVDFPKSRSLPIKFANLMSEISHLKYMESLNLYDYSLQNISMADLKAAISRTELVKIKQLEICRNHDVVTEDLAYILVFYAVEELDLYQCDVNQKQLTDLINGITKISCGQRRAVVKKINFAENPKIGCEALGRLLPFLPDLKYLDFYNCKLGQNDIEEILKGLRDFGSATPLHIEELWFKRNSPCCKQMGNLAVLCGAEYVYSPILKNNSSLFWQGVSEEKKRLNLAFASQKWIELLD